MATPQFVIRNPDNSVHLDLNMRLPRFLGTYTIGIQETTGSIWHPGFATGQAFYIPVDFNSFSAPPKLYFENNTLKWTYLDYDPVPPVEQRYSYTIDYGVY